MDSSEYFYLEGFYEQLDQETKDAVDNWRAAETGYREYLKSLAEIAKVEEDIPVPFGVLAKLVGWQEQVRSTTTSLLFSYSKWVERRLAQRITELEEGASS
jgi:hypothetical protein